MKKINYYFENIVLSKNNLCAKYKFVDFIIKEKKIATEINFIFCDDKSLQKINKKYLQHTELTDVITFDYSQKKNLWGDVYISTERVKENASIYNVSFKSELARVMIHGVLHLMGHKDKSPEQKKKMRELENKFLKTAL